MAAQVGPATGDIPTAPNHAPPSDAMQQLLAAQVDAMRQALEENSALMTNVLAHRLQEAFQKTQVQVQAGINMETALTMDLPGTLPKADRERDDIFSSDDDDDELFFPQDASLRANGTAAKQVGDTGALSGWAKNARASAVQNRQAARMSRSDKAGPYHGEKEDPNATNKKEEAQKAVFADASAMKEKIRAAVNKKQYSVFDYYWETGYAQMVARSNYFENITLAVIAFNALWISVDADHNKAELLMHADPAFIIAENFFCLYFSMEWAIRFASFKNKVNCMFDFWFVFDSAMCLLMVLETWVMTAVIYATNSSSSGTPFDPAVLKLFRLMRLSRMARMARLLRAMPELMILIKAIGVAMRSVVFTLGLLMIIMYVFAIAARQLTMDTDVGEKYFPSVPDSMFNLLMEMILPDQSGIVYDAFFDSGSPRYLRVINVALLLSFCLLGGLTVMNMLVGVLVEVVSVVSSVEKESLIVNFVKAQLQHLMTTELDDNAGESLTRAEFQKLLVNKKAAVVLEEVGVDVVGLVDFQEHIFRSDDKISFANFMEVVLQLRGSNTATVRDIVDLRKFLADSLRDVCDKVGDNSKYMRVQTPSGTTKLMGASPLPALALSHASAEVPWAPGGKQVLAATMSGKTTSALALEAAARTGDFRGLQGNSQYPNPFANQYTVIDGSFASPPRQRTATTSSPLQKGRSPQVQQEEQRSLVEASRQAAHIPPHRGGRYPYPARPDANPPDLEQLDVLDIDQNTPDITHNGGTNEPKSGLPSSLRVIETV